MRVNFVNETDDLIQSFLLTKIPRVGEQVALQGFLTVFNVKRVLNIIPSPGDPLSITITLTTNGVE